MTNIAIVLFGLSACGGAYLAWRHLSGRTPGVPLALVHGAAGAAGLVVLALALQASGTLGRGLGTAALAVFVLAATGGFLLFGLHLKGRPLPKAGVLVHAAAAVVGFLALLAFAFGRG
ncbi:MAG: hypothetical protein KGL53_10330 [Elusimicrobia bacterium]|nr:hypothetical protein [Elusimicrobiota bacterium]